MNCSLQRGKITKHHMWRQGMYGELLSGQNHISYFCSRLQCKEAGTLLKIFSAAGLEMYVQHTTSCYRLQQSLE